MLFEPVRNQAIDDEMDETASLHTNVGSKAYEKGGGIVVDDPKLLQVLKVRCCMCGVMTQPNAANTCIGCLKSQIDITEGIPRTDVLYHCRECNRYLRPPWVACELESADLLSLCLKNIKGLKRVKLLDAAFVWTEPHSRRIKVKVTV